MGSPWQSQPGMKDTLRPLITLYLTMMSFITCLRQTLKVMPIAVEFDLYISKYF
jgi:hypothetical protein